MTLHSIDHPVDHEAFTRERLKLAEMRAQAFASTGDVRTLLMTKRQIVAMWFLPYPDLIADALARA
ncbi:hypothetical protein [Alloyangia pacifica]|uniref:Uncharacterized protein n=1 Tax=Alloyangia pacifica TaxID=311180 RepID=A0A1I6PNF9_9RHOB|nr:hypothetical protein [Alloyangia pacifica]SDG31909.1 hypothetical protein SAMN04488245_102356 [Alloyangia pacifica]SFS41618.1 hypothetical protein SAMN04488050_101657 [Alloyangia pacifica]